MTFRQTGKRGWVLTFDNNKEWITNLYLCFAPDNIYLVDTYCGEDSMLPVLAFIRNQDVNKPLIIVNTHAHWDHVWGNSAFAGSPIIAHEQCALFLQQYWDQYLADFGQFRTGKVGKRLPDILIKDKWQHIEDEVEIKHTPGHTSDSISFYDKAGGVVFVGDNVESPLPYVESADLVQYQLTLNQYLAENYRTVLSSHAEKVDNELIRSNIDYIDNLRKGIPMEFDDPYASKVHQMNLDFLRNNNEV
ncbi:MAG: MBL fold metallo-hydrolase [Bacteroidetes bacterium]|nr:MBL fold metallo-hydrolase [Bacteroidota bacterium]